MIIESIQKGKHQQRAFRCGEESLDRFLHESAHQAVTKGLSKTYVAVSAEDETRILGYYTITTTQLDAGVLPERIAKKLKLPKNSALPALLIGRLAVAENLQRKHGIGSLMLMDAMARCARVASETGGVAIIVDALKESVVGWYEKYGFSRFEPKSLKLFIMMASVRELLGIPEQQHRTGLQPARLDNPSTLLKGTPHRGPVAVNWPRLKETRPAHPTFYRTCPTLKCPGVVLLWAPERGRSL